jgi:hypothetical protein
MMVIMVMVMQMFMTVLKIVAMQMGLSAGQPRVLAEHQRFDRHRYGHRGQPDAAGSM